MDLFWWSNKGKVQGRWEYMSLFVFDSWICFGDPTRVRYKEGEDTWVCLFVCEDGPNILILFILIGTPIVTLIQISESE